MVTKTADQYMVNTEENFGNHFFMIFYLSCHKKENSIVFADVLFGGSIDEAIVLLSLAMTILTYFCILRVVGRQFSNDTNH